MLEDATIEKIFELELNRKIVTKRTHINFYVC